MGDLEFEAFVSWWIKWLANSYLVTFTGVKSELRIADERVTMYIYSDYLCRACVELTHMLWVGLAWRNLCFFLLSGQKKKERKRNTLSQRSYIGQTGGRLELRYKEHVRHITTYNPQSAYTSHILSNAHECSPMGTTVTLLQAAQKGRRMSTLDNYCIQLFNRSGSIIKEQSHKEINPLFLLVCNAVALGRS